jgi:hypothetical protein
MSKPKKDENIGSIMLSSLVTNGNKMWISNHLGKVWILKSLNDCAV